MAPPQPLVLHAVVTAAERPITALAAETLLRELARAGAPGLDIGCVFHPSLAAAGAAGGAIVIASLLPEAETFDEPWPAVSRRLQADYQAITRGDGCCVFICTVLRHVVRGVVPGDVPDAAQRLRIRIRRLNLLAAEISRETGAHVIDIDRALADIGARVLETDYRLAGMRATEAAAACVALTLLAVGLDDYAPYEAQEAARAAIAARLRALHQPGALPIDMIRRDVIAMGTGRRRQHVTAIVDSVQENHVGWLLRCVLTRRISLSDAFARVLFAVGRRGLRGSLAVLLGGCVTLVRGGIRAAPTQR